MLLIVWLPLITLADNTTCYALCFNLGNSMTHCCYCHILKIVMLLFAIFVIQYLEHFIKIRHMIITLFLTLLGTSISLYRIIYCWYLKLVLIPSWLWQSISTRTHSRNVQNVASSKCCSWPGDWNATYHSAVQGLYCFQILYWTFPLSLIAYYRMFFFCSVAAYCNCARWTSN
jgi:hypothetical protein